MSAKRQKVTRSIPASKRIRLTFRNVRSCCRRRDNIAKIKTKQAKVIAHAHIHAQANRRIMAKNMGKLKTSMRMRCVQ